LEVVASELLGWNGKAFGFSCVVLVGNAGVVALFIQATASAWNAEKTFVFGLGLNGRALGLSCPVLMDDMGAAIPFI